MTATAGIRHRGSPSRIPRGRDRAGQTRRSSGGPCRALRAKRDALLRASQVGVKLCESGASPVPAAPALVLAILPPDPTTRQTPWCNSAGDGGFRSTRPRSHSLRPPLRPRARRLSCPATGRLRGGHTRPYAAPVCISSGTVTDRNPHRRSVTVREQLTRIVLFDRVHVVVIHQHS